MLRITHRLLKDNYLEVIVKDCMVNNQLAIKLKIKSDKGKIKDT